MNTNFNYKQLGFICAAFIIICIGNVIIIAQKKYDKSDFCRNDNWTNGKNVSAKDSRETTISAPGTLSVDGKRNGGIEIRGENRSDVLVRSCVQAWANSDEAAGQIVRDIKVETGSNIYAENPNSGENWSVSYEISVPLKMNLNLKAHNGGLIIKNVDGNIEFETKNGGVILTDLAGDVKGTTTNGGIIVNLAGNSWHGNGLDVETRNGGLNISLDENYAANFETGTVNGGIQSDIKGLQVPKKKDDENGWYRRNQRINTNLNGGGAKVRIITTNGGVTIDKP
jgi:hypothetical protein